MIECVNLIMQGDSYAIPFKIKTNGEYIDINDINKIEFMVGSLKKYYGEASATVAYDSSSHQFLFPLSQQESLAFDGPQKIQVRVKDVQNNVVGKIYGFIQLQFSLSEVVL